MSAEERQAEGNDAMVDINTSSVDDLARVVGLGRTAAEAIVAARRVSTMSPCDLCVMCHSLLFCIVKKKYCDIHVSSDNPRNWRVSDAAHPSVIAGTNCHTLLAFFCTPFVSF